MTIVISAYVGGRRVGFGVRSADQYSSPASGAIILCDSLYSGTGVNEGERRVVAHGAQKMKPIAIKIGLPDLSPSGYPTGRAVPFGDWSCGVAFAGDVVFSLSVFGRFEELASGLCYGFDASSQPPSYQICLPRDPLVSACNSLDEDVDFSPLELPRLSAQFVADLLKGAIEDTLASFTGDGTSGYARLVETSFALAVFCEEKKAPVIFELLPHEKFNTATISKIEEGALLILGAVSLSDRFVESLAAAGPGNELPALLHCLNEVIKEERDKKLIGGSAAVGVLDRHGFTVQQ